MKNESNSSEQTTQLLDIYATGGTNFCVRLIEDYDPAQQASIQDGKHLGNVKLGDLDDEGQYLQDDDEVIEHVRAEYDIDESVPAKVR